MCHMQPSEEMPDTRKAEMASEVVAGWYPVGFCRDKDNSTPWLLSHYYDLPVCPATLDWTGVEKSSPKHFSLNI